MKRWLQAAALGIACNSCVSAPAYHYGTTSRGVEVTSDVELRNEVDLQDISTIHDAMLWHFSEKQSIASSWSYLKSFELKLYDAPLPCPYDNGCGGLAHPSGTMEVTWRVIARTELGDADVDPFCPAFTAVSHELYHLLLHRETGDIDGDHSGCWTLVQEVRNDVYDELCGTQP